MRNPSLVLVDANAIIEAVRTKCWAAITGQLRVETVEECRDEVLRGSPQSIAGYVPVGEEELNRLMAVHHVDKVVRADFQLTYSNAGDMDAGERDLFAHAHAHAEGEWALCSPDRASIRAAVALGIGDRAWSLERLSEAVGARPNPGLREQFKERWLRGFRTRVRLEEP